MAATEQRNDIIRNIPIVPKMGDHKNHHGNLEIDNILNVNNAMQTALRHLTLFIREKQRFINATNEYFFRGKTKTKCI